MEDEVCEVMALGVEAIELAINHMGDPGEGMPVSCVACLKSPQDTLKIESILYGAVLCHIDGVVIKNEIMP